MPLRSTTRRSAAKYSGTTAMLELGLYQGDKLGSQAIEVACAEVHQCVDVGLLSAGEISRRS